MQAKAGLAPWNPASLTKGMTWDLSSGYRKRYSGFKKTKKYKSNGQMRTLHNADGTEVKLYYSENYKDSRGFYAHESEDMKTQKALAFAEDAFDSSRPDHGAVYTENGAGHISKVEYAVREKILRVTFVSGSVCIFFNVPTSVGGQLIWLAKKGDNHTRSDGRHYLGIEFWDLVRIRGQRYGANYPFEYEAHGAYKLTGDNTRYRIQLTKHDYEKLFFNRNHKEFEIQEQIRPFNDGDIISIIATEDELAEYALYLQDIGEDVKARQMLEKAGHGKKVSRTNERGETTEDFVSYTGNSDEDEQYSSENARYVGAGGSNPAEQSAFTKALGDMHATISTQTDAWRGMILDKAESLYQSPAVKAVAAENMESRGMEPGEANLRAFRDVAIALGRQDILKAIDQGEMRKAMLDLKESLRNDNAHIQRLASIADGHGALQTWLKENFYAAYANMSLQRGWTPQQLKDFANYHNPGCIRASDARRYKKYIDNMDWQGALDFLKGTKVTVELVGKDGKKTGQKFKRSYAGGNDFLAMEED